MANGDALIRLESPFVDSRGTIQNLVDDDIKSAVLITSNAGALRANHYHLSDWHYCYVIEGCIDYHHRPHGSVDPPERLLVGQHQMVFTPAMVEHAMTFPEPTTFLTLSRNRRDHASYEDDVVRVQLILP